MCFDHCHCYRKNMCLLFVRKILFKIRILISPPKKHTICRYNDDTPAWKRKYSTTDAADDDAALFSLVDFAL